MIEPDDRILHRCPMCLAIGFLHVGKPPSTVAHEYFNRCIGHALTGEPSYVKFHFRGEPHWRAPCVNFHKCCGMEFTHSDGSTVEPLPSELYMQITKYPFSPKALRSRIHQQSEAKKRGMLF